MLNKNLTLTLKNSKLKKHLSIIKAPSPKKYKKTKTKYELIMKKKISNNKS